MLEDIILNKLAEKGIIPTPEAWEILQKIDEGQLRIILETIPPGILSRDQLSYIFSWKKTEIKCLQGLEYENTRITGEISEFIEYFRSRLQKIRGIINKKQAFLENSDAEVIKFIGLVTSKEESRNGNIVLEIEDETTCERVVIPKEDHNIFDKAKYILMDQVIGVKAKRIANNLCIAKEIIWPDIAPQQVKFFTQDYNIVLTSDIHYGSNKFLEENFKLFIKWLNLEYGTEEERKIAERVKYILICGDIVDGVGIYKGQEKELEIKDIYEQYEGIANLLAQIRNDIQIIIIPGNHDAVRQAEPQPQLDKEVCKPLYELSNVKIYGNPAVIEIDGNIITLYHGRSIDGMFKLLKTRNVEDVMKEMLRGRHLAPIFGENGAPLFPTKEDYHVIEHTPTILHTAHVHINATLTYKNVIAVNSGCWQAQTDYQRQQGLEPTPAKVPVLDLTRKELKVLDFYRGNN